ncbi:MAG: DUF4369 domain-containing protein [Alloprevotella sp.]|nr:DUF4369 domain-containing protein [Alloprevotella sp.]
MRKIHRLCCGVLVLTTALLTSCSEEYSIAGRTTIPMLDGQMLHLRTTADDMTQMDIDSCMVVHGHFSFYGDVDTVRMAQVYLSHDFSMPIVIETGNLSIQVDNMGSRVTGSPMNDKLYKFFQKQAQLNNQLADLDAKFLKMANEGKTLDEIRAKLMPQRKKILERAEKEEAKFIVENSDNILGPGYFMMMSSQFPTPVITEGISRILDEVSPEFFNSPYVRNYIYQASLNPLSAPVLKRADKNKKQEKKKRKRKETQDWQE